MPNIEITVDGRPALTTAQAATRHGLKPSSLRGEIARAGLEPVAELDARTPLYDAEQLAAALAARPGKGAHLRRESAPSPGSDRS